MSVVLTEEQTMLRDMIASYLADNYGFEARQATVRSESGWRPDIWKGFAEELGIFGASFSEEHGGFGGGAIDNMIIMEELGKALVLEPYLGTVVIGGGFLKHGGHVRAAEWIGQVISGDMIIAFAQAEAQSRYNLADIKTTATKGADGWVLNGRKAVVVGASWANHLIVTARTSGGQRDAVGVSVFLVDKATPGISLIDYKTIDGSRASDVIFENVTIPADALIGAEGGALPLIERVVDEAIAATCAEACGVMKVLQADTIEYTQQRKQFGVPLASFQVLQHRMVDMFIAMEKAGSMTTMATQALDAADEARAKAVSAAKVSVGQASRYVSQNAVQLHGGIGTTEELKLSHYFKRAAVLETIFGSVDHHLARFEALSLDHAA